jgi:hypothetical protein
VTQVSPSVILLLTLLVALRERELALPSVVLKPTHVPCGIVIGDPKLADKSPADAPGVIARSDPLIFEEGLELRPAPVLEYNAKLTALPDESPDPTASW